MAGQRGLIATVSTGWRCFVALCLMFVVGTSLAGSLKVYDLDLREQSVADALNGLSEQTSVPVVFPYDLVKDRRANPVIGRYTLLEALDALLKDTGLSGGLSDKGVLTISAGKSGTGKSGETIVTSAEQHQQNTNSSKRTHLAGIAALLALLNSPHASHAQEQSSTSLDEVLVSAQKRGDERLQDVPVPVAVIDGQDLANNNQILLRDYYTAVPDLIVQPSILAQQIVTIRGIGSGGAGGTGPTVGVMVDDVPYGGSLNATGGFWLPDLDPGDIDHIEVLRGPQGTLYGANSMGGLLKFVTKDPSTEAFSGQVQTGVSTVYNGAEPGFDERASANIPLNDQMAIRVSGFSRQDPGYIDNPILGTKGVNEAWSDGARLGGLWKISDAVTFKLSALYQHAKSNGSSDVDVAQFGGPVGLHDLQQNYIPNIGGYEKTNQAYSATFERQVGRHRSHLPYRVQRQQRLQLPRLYLCSRAYG